jgi:hypothetical protein
MFAAASASASTYVTDRSPGSSTFTRTLGSYDMGLVSLNSGRTTAYRSPASSGMQKVTITWRVFRPNGSTWQLADASSITYDVYQGQYVNDLGWTWRGLSNYYATDLTITWKTPTGTFLGSAYRDLIHYNDYQCANSQGCSVGWFGGQYSLAMY